MCTFVAIPPHSEKARGIGFEMKNKMKFGVGGWFSP
jgi:hypothetical protein